jgi:hypothetical protein
MEVVRGLVDNETGESLPPGRYDIPLFVKDKFHFDTDIGGGTGYGETKVVDEKVERLALPTKPMVRHQFPCLMTNYATLRGIKHSCQSNCKFSHDPALFLDEVNLKEAVRRVTPNCRLSNCPGGCPFNHLKAVAYDRRPTPKVMIDNKWKVKEKEKKDDKKPETLAGGIKFTDYWSSPYSFCSGRLFMSNENTQNWSGAVGHCTIISGRVYFPCHDVHPVGKRWLAFLDGTNVISQEVDLKDCRSDVCLPPIVNHLLSYPIWSELAAKLAKYRSLRWSKARPREGSSLLIPTYGNEGQKLSGGGRFKNDQMCHDIPTEFGDCGAPYIVGDGLVAACHMHGQPNGGLNPYVKTVGAELSSIVEAEGAEVVNSIENIIDTSLDHQYFDFETTPEDFQW